MELTYDQAKWALLRLLQEHSVKHGDFTLRSGKKSDFYVDCRPVILSNLGHKLIGRTLGHLVNNGIFGSNIAVTGTGGFHIASAIASQYDISVIHIRSGNKEHGTKNEVELPFDFEPRSKAMLFDDVVIVDDVLTTGSSIEFCINKLKSLDINVQSAYVLVDREEGGWESLCGKYRISVRSVFTKSDFEK